MHKCSVDILLNGSKDVGELLSTEYAQQKAMHRKYLSKILQNIVFLARQGLPMRGNWVKEVGGGGSEENSNFHQLMLLRSLDDPTILDMMKGKSHKYTDHHGIMHTVLSLL